MLGYKFYKNFNANKKNLDNKNFVAFIQEVKSVMYHPQLAYSDQQVASL